MTARRLERMLASRSTPCAACGFTLALGLFFIFVWAPHPWGWGGFDRYDTLALTLAQGQPFPTLEVPWGYAYFVAAFYRVFGHHLWIPLVVQAALNACLPLLVFAFARTWLDRPASVLAAVLTGLFSFNTVYASTLSSDAVCTIVFMSALVLFCRARRGVAGEGRWEWYAGTGLLTGVAAQLRPNLILVPPLLAAYAAAERPGPRRLGQAAALVLSAAITLTPWVVRNYRLTGVVLPTSVHGGVQLWYGSLQVGPYLHSRAHNPRRVFEDSVFEYTSLDRLPLVVTAHANACGRPWPSVTSLVYWTDRSPERHRLVSQKLAGDGRLSFDIPAVGGDAVVYYYFDTTWWSDRGERVRLTPHAGETAPFVYFVSQDHLGDLDVHGDLLDIFDVIRIARHAVWGEPLPFARQLAAAGIGESDLETAVEILAPRVAHADGPAAAHADAPRPLVVSIDRAPDELMIRLFDGSSIVVPRAWSGHITDISFDGTMAAALIRSHASLALLASVEQGVVAPEHGCPAIEEIAMNQVFYRREPAMMRRYVALAEDNIRREPWAFARATVYRAFRVFVIEGSDDPFTAQQFRAGSTIYAVATAASATYLMLFTAGVAVAWRRRYPIALPLLLIAYVPATIAFLLTNMRYSITVQPLLLIFIAIALEAALETLRLVPASPAGAAAAPDRGGT